jgi:hypothetical protein
MGNQTEPSPLPKFSLNSSETINRLFLHVLKVFQEFNLSPCILIILFMTRKNSKEEREVKE